MMFQEYSKTTMVKRVTHEVPDAAAAADDTPAGDQSADEYMLELSFALQQDDTSFDPDSGSDFGDHSGSTQDVSHVVSEKANSEPPPQQDSTGDVTGNTPNEPRCPEVHPKASPIPPTSGLKAVLWF